MLHLSKALFLFCLEHFPLTLSVFSVGKNEKVSGKVFVLSYKSSAVYLLVAD